MFSRTAFRRTTSSSAATGRRRPRRTLTGWSESEAAAMIAAPGVAVSSPPGRTTVSRSDRRAEDEAVSARLDLAWRRLEAARSATEGRPGGIGDDTARRDPVTRPFPIVFGTPARTPRSGSPAPASAASPASPAAAPSPAVPGPTGPRAVRRGQAAVSMYRPAGAGQVPRARAPRRLTADRWSAAVG